MTERRTVRVQQRVVHRHRVGTQVFRRVSEFVFVRGEPKAVLRWIDVGGIRTPIYLDLDPAKLRRIRAGTSTLYVYKGTTLDPVTLLEPHPPMRGRRSADSEPMPGGRRRTDPPLEDAR